ncbi:MAG: bile acid:sodium symporter [Streptosporangiaceae bacterium]
MSGPRRGRGLAGPADVAERFLLPLVLAVAAAGVAWPGAGRALAARDGIDATLAVLVFATGLSLRLADLATVRTAWRRITLVLAVSTAALPALAWAASQLIASRMLRAGMQTAGVAPAEVATVALCALAGGDAAVCAVILAASTLITVLAAGPVLTLLGSAAAVPAAALLGTLLAVVALPLAAGIGLRAVWAPGGRGGPAVRIVTVTALLVLLWQVASQIRLDAGYLRVIAALAVFIAGSALLGGLLAVRLPAGRSVAVLLPVTMRDFAVAAGIAATAFGPAAAAPLGGYGVLVLLTGSVVTAVSRGRRRSAPAGGVGPGPPGN